MNNKTIGLYLIIDAVISIYLASVGNITLTLANLSAQSMLLLGQIGRIVRLWLGLYLMGSEKINNIKLIGGYIIADSLLSIYTANEFNSWDDYLRISRLIVGGYLLR